MEDFCTVRRGRGGEGRGGTCTVGQREQTARAERQDKARLVGEPITITYGMLEKVTIN
jgi:hypothetical protein